MKKSPVAKKIPHQTKIFGETLEDDYFWLRDDKYPDVREYILDYLKEENAYAEGYHEKFKDLEEEIFQEMKSRLIENDTSWPVQVKQYKYYYELKEGLNHPIYFRKHIDTDNITLLIDPNILAEQSKSFSLGDVACSYCDKFMAFSFDMIGKERYLIQVKNLITGEVLVDRIEDASGDDIIWDKESKGFFYLKLDSQWRTNRLYYHKLGKLQSEDLLIYHEKDPIFRLAIEESSDEKYLLFYIASSTASECYYLPLENPFARLEKIYPRENEHLVSIDHQDDHFYMSINDVKNDFRLVKFPLHHCDKLHWKEVISETDIGYITGFYMIKDYLVVSAKYEGIENIYLYHNDSLYTKIPFSEKNYEISAAFTEYETDFIRIEYNSMITPLTIFEFNIKNKVLNCRKVKDIPGYDPELYEYDRIFAPSREEGIMIPISIVYKKTNFTQESHCRKTLLYGYGSYGLGMNAYFNSNIFSLLDRGYYYVIAHIRGGDDMGFDWYEQAKFLNKKRTFNDFIDVAKYLIAKNYTSPDLLSIIGGSAGGMLVGVVTNEHPELFKTAVALVPFVDVLNTMLDESLPLTPGEFKEWGDPKSEDYFHYIKSYSPYDNVEKRSYPNLLVTAGINDPRVTYWEPAKWVAKLREYKTDENLLLFKTELEQGHKGAIGRYDRIKEYAFYYAFIQYTLCL